MQVRVVENSAAAPEVVVRGSSGDLQGSSGDLQKRLPKEVVVRGSSGALEGLLEALQKLLPKDRLERLDAFRALQAPLKDSRNLRKPPGDCRSNYTWRLSESHRSLP